jgi:hypothetical protein
MAIIKNYGFLWDRRHIKRGRGEHLKGKSKERSGEVDFAEQIGIYALYDDSQAIVYVGQAGNGNANLLTRLKQHSDGALWNRWRYFSWIGFREINVRADSELSKQQDTNSQVSGYKYGQALNEMEGVLIEFIEPKLNKQSGRLTAATEYFQVLLAEGKTLDELGRTIDQLGTSIEGLKHDMQILQSNIKKPSVKKK